MENAEAYIGLLIQVPLVGIFIWFTLRIVDRFLKTLEQRDLQWQEFLAGQRKENSEALSSLAARLGDEIKSIAVEVARFNGVLTAHDARSQVYERIKITE